MRQMTADEQMALFDEDDWSSLSDSVISSGGPKLSPPALRRLYANLPDHIRDNVVHWGMSDTPTRDSIFEFLERNPKIRDAAGDDAEQAADGVAWVAPHQTSEDYAALAQAALVDGRTDDAKDLFAHAASAEEAALSQVSDDHPRIFGVLAVRSVRLRRLSGDNKAAAMLAHMCLANSDIPDAERELLDSELLEIYLKRAARVDVQTLMPKVGNVLPMVPVASGDATASLSDHELVTQIEIDLSKPGHDDALVRGLIRRFATVQECLQDLRSDLDALRNRGQDD